MIHPLDVRSDLYSLGVVAYECVAGRLPFLKSSSTTSLLYQHVLDRPPALPRLHVGSIRARALEDLVIRLLEKDPSARPPSASALGAELARIEQDLSRAAAALPDRRAALIGAIVVTSVVSASAFAWRSSARRGFEPLPAPQKPIVAPIVVPLERKPPEAVIEPKRESPIDRKRPASVPRTRPPPGFISADLGE